jgi:pSer/pThr/pTyr-binding forkhead associated (FHA) protein
VDGGKAGRAAQAAVPPLRLVLQPTGFAVDIEHSDVILGRHSSAEVRIPLPDISRHHCRFVFTSGTWQVLDLDSLNGVFVNGKRVSESTLRDRDMLGIGGFQFLVLTTPAAPSLNEESKTQALLPPLGGQQQRRAS